ncbi:MAG: hypothetical protein C0614_09820 [Desulfuromonas sp.]|nr:MAG: hypothetical protein C0614_09820 [Desulfuromonas sp.]
MKKLVLLIIVSMALSGFAYAQQVGPGVPPPNLPGKMASPNFGVGYYFQQAEFEGLAFEEDRIYAHLGAVFGDASTPNYELFMRIGGATLEEENGFDGSGEMTYAAGIKGEFYQGTTFGWGGVLQGMYVDSYEDSVQVGNQEVNLALEKCWEVELAFPLHARFRKALFYMGPLFYSATADVASEAFFSNEGDIDEDHNVGAFGGLVIRGKQVSLEIEGKYRSDMSGGAMLSFTF